MALPILGADFLGHFNFMVDLRRKHLVGPDCSYVQLSAPKSSIKGVPVGVVAEDTTATAGDAQQPQATSLCTRPPAAVISQQLAGVVQQPQAASLCAWQPYSDATPEPFGWVTPAEREGVAGAAGVAQQPQAASLCARPPAAVISTPPLTQTSVAAEFPRVLTASKKLPPVQHKVEHVIETTCSRPVTSRYRRLDPEKLEVARKEFAEMEAQGIVARSSSSWASPLHMVEKADGSWRPCGDFRLLNLATKPDLYPPPHMEDLSARLAGMKIFSKLDLRKGYYQVPVAAKEGAEDRCHHTIRPL